MRSARACSSAPALGWMRLHCRPGTTTSIGYCGSTSCEAERNPEPDLLERPAAVLADADARGRIGAVWLPGGRLDSEHRAWLEIVLAADDVARDVRTRRHDDRLLAIGIFDHEALVTALGARYANDDWLHEAIGHGAVGCAIPPRIVMTAIGLRTGENMHLDGLLAAVGLRYCAAADVVARLDIGNRRFQHGRDRCVVGELDRDRTAIAPARKDEIAERALDGAAQALALLLPLGQSRGQGQRRGENGDKGAGKQNAHPAH